MQMHYERHKVCPLTQKGSHYCIHICFCHVYCKQLTEIVLTSFHMFPEEGYAFGIYLFQVQCKFQNLLQHMIKFKGHSQMKQYIRNKPHKVGIQSMAKAWGIIRFLIRIRHLYGVESSSRIWIGRAGCVTISKKVTKF